MSKINNSITSIFLRQIYLITKHQDLADCNAPNQLMEMVESLNMLAEAIGNSNASAITSVDEETLNVYIARVHLVVNEEMENSDSDEDG